MSTPPTIRDGARFMAVIGLAACLVMGCKKAAPPGGPAKPAAVPVKTNALAAVTNGADMAYVSVFEDLLPPNGKDPFFPNSHRREPSAPAAATPQHAVPRASSSDLALKAIVRSAKSRMVIINDQILAPGEEASVRVPSGRLQVTCLEIGDDYALIKVEGEAEPKRLEMVQKKQ